MKALNVILKIVAVLAVIAGIAFVVVKYGEQIVAWCKETFYKIKGLCGGKCQCDCSCQCEDDCENCNCESDCNECPCENCCDEADIVEEATEEASAEDVPADAVQAEENDFEG